MKKIVIKFFLDQYRLDLVNRLKGKYANNKEAMWKIVQIVNKEHYQKSGRLGRLNPSTIGLSCA